LPVEHPLAPLEDGFLSFCDGDFTAALTVFDEFVKNENSAPAYLVELASDIAILAGDFEKAEQLILRREPLLQSDAKEQIDRINVRNVVKLAYVYQKRGQPQLAKDLLDGALTVVQTLPRLGMFGYGIRDVQIFALMGRKEDALNALRQAIDEGFRSPVVFDNWLLDYDPLLTSIHDDARFTAMMSELDALNVAMYTNVQIAEESGDWKPLAGRARAN
jgi:tetratricopeptide (TPR) repeat protein